jgi:hypothetical protein
VTYHALLAHPSSPAVADLTLTAQAQRLRADALTLSFVLSGPLQHVRVPAETSGTRADELWRHTCFEAFVALAGVPGYLEFNFSPSLAWQAYRFSARRVGMTPAHLPAPPVLTVGHRVRSGAQARVRGADDALVLEALVCLPEPYAEEGQPLHLALSAVLEDEGGVLSYWALRHAPGRPDFHHPDAFALTLDALGAERQRVSDPA